MRLAVIGLLGLALVPGVLYRRVETTGDRQPTRRADTLIVMGCGGTAEEPSFPYRMRLHHALNLYADQFAPHIIVTEKSPAAEGARRWLIQQGVAPAAIAVENRSRTTWENLIYSREIMRKRGWRSAIIVSCPFHIYRSLYMARELGINAQGTGAPYSPFANSPHARSLYSWMEVRKLFAHAIWEPTPEGLDAYSRIRSIW